jgi:hypothetical protein
MKTKDLPYSKNIEDKRARVTGQTPEAGMRWKNYGDGSSMEPDIKSSGKTPSGLPRPTLEELLDGTPSWGAGTTPGNNNTFTVNATGSYQGTTPKAAVGATHYADDPEEKARRGF